MDIEQMVGLALAVVVMLIGVAGSFIPMLPGLPLIVAAGVVHRMYFGAHGANTPVLVIIALMAVVANVVDYAAGILGAKKMGATWRGVVGAVVGGIVGLFFSLPGIILGPFVGALLLELTGGREFKPAAKAGMGAVLGLLVGAVGKLAMSLVMILLFITSVIFRST